MGNYDFMAERITEDAGKAFAPSRYTLKSRADAIIQPYRTYDLMFEITFHVLQKLGAYEDIGTPDECRKAVERLQTDQEKQPETLPKELEGLTADDLYLIGHFGMTRQAIARVLNNVVRLVDYELEQFAEAVDPEHEELDDLVDGGFWDENGNMRWNSYGASKVAFAVFKDAISWNTRYGGAGSATEACRMCGIDGFEPLARRKQDE